MTQEIKIGENSYHWPTDAEWVKLKPIQRRERALRLLVQAVRQENRVQSLSIGLQQALFLADDALGRHPED